MLYSLRVDVSYILNLNTDFPHLEMAIVYRPRMQKPISGLWQSSMWTAFPDFVIVQLLVVAYATGVTATWAL